MSFAVIKRSFRNDNYHVLHHLETAMGTAAGAQNEESGYIKAVIRYDFIYEINQLLV